MVFTPMRVMGGTEGDLTNISQWEHQCLPITSLREALAAKSRLASDFADGVEAVVDPLLEKRIHGAAVMTAFVSTAGRRSRPRNAAEKIFVVRLGDRTYHAEYRGYYESPERHALSQALEAWQRQKRYEVRVKSDLRIPEGVSVLVYKADSYAVGNCRPGTEAFMRTMKIRVDTLFVSHHKLMAHAAGNSRAYAVLAYAVRKLREQLAGQREKAA